MLLLGDGTSLVGWARGRLTWSVIIATAVALALALVPLVIFPPPLLPLPSSLLDLPLPLHHGAHLHACHQWGELKERGGSPGQLPPLSVGAWSPSLPLMVHACVRTVSG
jgi:hypothetical protein